MKLSITQENIDQAIPAHGYLDPIGLAVQDAYPKAQIWGVISYCKYTASPYYSYNVFHFAS